MTEPSDREHRARPAEPQDEAYLANVWKVYLLHFLMHFQLWWSIWVLYLKDMRGFSLTQIAILEALFWGAAVLAEVPTGAVADRFGRKVSLALGAGSTAIAVLVFGFATSYWLTVVSYLVWAIGFAFLSGAEHAILFESLKAVGKEHQYQRAAGRMGAVFSFGALAGGLVGAPIAAATDLSIPVVLSAAIAAPGVLVALTLREPPLPDGEVRLAYGPLLRESVRTATRLPTVRYMLVLAALISAVTFGPMIFMQPFLTGHGVKVAFIGFIQTPVRVMGMVGALVAYQVTSRLGIRGAFIAAPLLMGGAYLTLGAWDAVYAFAAFPFIFFVNSLLLPPASDYLNRRIPSSQRATILSLRTMLSSLGAAILVPALGVAADGISLRAAFWITGSVVVVLLPPALVLWLRADQREREEGAVKA